MYALVAQMVEQRTENPSVGGSIPPQGTTLAGVAQSAEQLICNQPVAGSIPVTGSTVNFTISYGKIPERPNGSDCKSDVFDFGGSNPPLPTKQASPIEDACFHVVFLFVLYAGAPFLPFDAKKGADSPAPLKCDRGIAVYARRAAAASSTMSVQSG